LNIEILFDVYMCVFHSTYARHHIDLQNMPCLICKHYDHHTVQYFTRERPCQRGLLRVTICVTMMWFCSICRDYHVSGLNESAIKPSSCKRTVTSTSVCLVKINTLSESLVGLASHFVSQLLT